MYYISEVAIEHNCNTKIVRNYKTKNEKKKFFFEQIQNNSEQKKFKDDTSNSARPHTSTTDLISRII